MFHGHPVTVIGTRKGKNLEENLRCNFGMPSPEGYRKARRLMEQAEKFRRPIVTLIDTSGAYPGLEAEARGQGEAIARNLLTMSQLTVPVVAVILGEGNSGGALALAVADRVLMLEHSVYAILSPEGFASILWKDAGRSGEAANLMKLTAPELLRLRVIDEVILEPAGGAHLAPAIAYREVDQALFRHLSALSRERGSVLTAAGMKNSDVWAWSCQMRMRPGRRSHERNQDLGHGTQCAGPGSDQRRHGPDCGHQ